MIIIRVEDENNVVVFDEETIIDANDCCEISGEINKLTIGTCLNYYHKMMKERKFRRKRKNIVFSSNKFRGEREDYKMDWKKEMQLAMLNIQTACQSNPVWSDCRECPFDDICTIIEAEIGKTPDEWEIEVEDE